MDARLRSADYAKRYSVINLLLMLENIPSDEPDFKFKAFLEVLIVEHKISPDTIAKFAKIQKQDVFDFMNGNSTVPIEEKYRLASVIMILRFIFKRLLIIHSQLSEVRHKIIKLEVELE